VYFDIEGVSSEFPIDYRTSLLRKWWSAASQPTYPQYFRHWNGIYNCDIPTH